MVDWNHNGERDSFDFAMDMMAMEEMERASSSKKNTYRSSSSASDDWGCILFMWFVVGVLSIISVYIVGTLQFLTDGTIWPPMILVTLLLVAIYAYRKCSKNNTIVNADDRKKEDSKKNVNQKERYNSGSSSSLHSGNTASYAVGLGISTLLPDDSDDDTDRMEGESTRDRLDFDLLGTGYDSYDLEWMDEDEREEIMWDNGLDPLDYDLDDLD